MVYVNIKEYPEEDTGFFARALEVNNLKGSILGISTKSILSESRLPTIKEQREAFLDFKDKNTIPVTYFYIYNRERETNNLLAKNMIKIENELRTEIRQLKQINSNFKLLYLFDIFERFPNVSQPNPEKIIETTVRLAYGESKNNLFIAVRVIEKENIDTLISLSKRLSKEFGIDLSFKIMPVLSAPLLEKLSEFDKVYSIIKDLFTKDFHMFGWDLYYPKKGKGNLKMDYPLGFFGDIRHLNKDIYKKLREDFKNELESRIPIFSVFSTRRYLNEDSEMKIGGSSLHSAFFHGIDIIIPITVDANKHRPENEAIRFGGRPPKWVYQQEEWYYQKTYNEKSERLKEHLSNNLEEHNAIRKGELKDMVRSIRGLQLVFTP